MRLLPSVRKANPTSAPRAQSPRGSSDCSGVEPYFSLMCSVMSARPGPSSGSARTAGNESRPALHRAESPAPAANHSDRQHHGQETSLTKSIFKTEPSPPPRGQIAHGKPKDNSLYGAAGGCDLLIFKSKRSQPPAARRECLPMRERACSAKRPESPPPKPRLQQVTARHRLDLRPVRGVFTVLFEYGNTAASNGRWNAS